jgi:hypothetical protein
MGRRRRGRPSIASRDGGGTNLSDGSTCHITWSLAGGRTGVESNDVIFKRGWTTVERLWVRLEAKLCG